VGGSVGCATVFLNSEEGTGDGLRELGLGKEYLKVVMPWEGRVGCV
jgi:hypothetical protein